MASYRSVAASVAQSKARRPDRFCQVERCLWRTGGGRCPQHPGTSEPALSAGWVRFSRVGDPTELLGRNPGGWGCTLGDATLDECGKPARYGKGDCHGACEAHAGELGVFAAAVRS